ncbi:hypothetical protein ACLKA6_002617 [Drosophila palustris]
MPADPTKIATPEMVTMPTGQAKGTGPRKPVFHPGLGVEGVILPPPITSELRQSAKSAAVSPAGARTVESALATHCFNLLEKEPGPPPICKDVGWFQGNVKVIACEDNRSAELYKAAVASVGEVYPGAKLEAINWEDVPARPRARMWFPSTIKQLLKMLQRCNPRLPTHDWRVAKIEETPGPTHQAVIILNKESLAPIDAAGGELNFGFSSVFIRVYKSDAAVGGAPSDKPVEEDITAELEAPERPELDGYNSDASSLTRDLSKLCKAGDLEVTSDLASEDEDANVTVVEGKSTDFLEGSADKPPPLNEDNTTVSLESQPAPIRLLSGYMPYDQVGLIPEDIARSLISDCANNKIDLIIGKGRSTETALHSVIANNVFPEAITGALTGLGVEGRLVRLINQLLTSRAVTSTLGSSTLTRRYKIPTLVPPKLKNSTLTFSESARYLGLVLDRKLNWNLNIQERFWWPALTKASTIKQLKKIQRMAEICITGALNTTPGEALDAILNITPIQQLSVEISTLSAIRLRDTNLWNEHPSGHSFILLNKNNIPPKTDYCMPIEHITTPFRTLIPRREEWAVKPPGKPGSLTFYTDGSKLKNQAEILAINDSQAAIKSIAATTTNSISVSKCRKSLHEMAGHFDICLIWVPGHQDIPGNCIADELARKGTTNFLLPDKEDTSMPLATCKLMLHNQSIHKSTLRWQASLVGRVGRQTWPKIDKARTGALCNLSRRNCSLVVRSLTGHWLIGTHAHRLNSPYNDFCRSCRDEDEESPEHFFCSCPALSSRRVRTLGKPFLDDLGGLSAL